MLVMEAVMVAVMVAMEEVTMVVETEVVISEEAMVVAAISRASMFCSRSSLRMMLFVRGERVKNQT